MPTFLTVAEHLDYLLPGSSKRTQPPTWPPDVFAIAASFLQISGGYCVVSCGWPRNQNWATSIDTSAATWRKRWQKGSPPARVQKLWSALLEGASEKVGNLANNETLCVTLMELLAIADEASAGVGVPCEEEHADELILRGEYLLFSSNATGGANLCVEVRDAAVRVLPKMHVPQSGFTLRSFSHYLALVPSTEIKPFWHTVPSAPIADRTLDILILPWPLRLSKENFKEVPVSKATMRNLPQNFGFFEFHHQNPDGIVERVLYAVQGAEDAYPQRSIDMVVMPELSLAPDEFRRLSSALLGRGVQLIAGIGGDSHNDGTRENAVGFNFPWRIPGGNPLIRHGFSTKQMKHHRWKLEGSQMARYGLSLSRKKQLWEHIPIRDRSLAFITTRDWLALCVLVCEDLARPDPVGDLIRAVGPNLVISILLDGPQLEGRWSGRYATALADDPGSSVLSLTCAGMASLSRSGGSDPYEHKGKIALWKDFHGVTRVIDIGDGDCALLHIEEEEHEGWTADGRSDGGTSGYPILKSTTIFKNGTKVGDEEIYNV